MSVVLALRTQTGVIVIAADSRLSFGELGKPPRVVHDIAPKILSVNGHVFAASGTVLLDDGVDAYAIARELMDVSVRSTVAKLAAAFLIAIEPHLIRRIDRAYVRPTTHDDIQGLPAIQFLFSNGHTEKKPALAWRNVFGVGRASTGVTRIEVVQAWNWPANRNTLLVGGELNHDHARQALLSYPSVEAAQATAEHLIALASAESPAVGGPVDIIAIEPRRVRWLRQKPEQVYGWASVPESEKRE